MKLVIAILIIYDNKERQLKSKVRYFNRSIVSQAAAARFL